MGRARKIERWLLTLGIQEVGNRHRMVRSVGLDIRNREDLLGMCLRADPHVFLAQSTRMGFNVGSFLSFTYQGRS